MELIRAFTEQLLAAAAEGSLIGMLLTLEEQHRSVAGAMLLDTSASVNLPALLRQYYRDSLELYVTACDNDEDGMVSACDCPRVLLLRCSTSTPTVARHQARQRTIHHAMQTVA